MSIRVTIVGGGIVGASIARVLSRYENLKVHIIEKMSDVGWGVSKANTALIHGGYDDDPQKYPLRASLCVKGNRLWQKWVKDLEIPHVWSGALIIALQNEDIKHLSTLLERGIRNGVPEMRLVEKEELQALQPGIASEATGALYVPTVGQIASPRATVAIIENAVKNGVKIHLETEVQGIKVSDGEVKGIQTPRGFMESDVVINAAGLYADEISRMVGLDYFTLRPRKGEYLIYRHGIPGPTRVLFPTPTPKSKGIIVTTEVGGHLMIGPNAQDMERDEKDNLATTEEGLKEVLQGARKLWPGIPDRGVIRTFAGLRPEPPNGDFIIRAEEVWGFINVAGIRSPGLTSAPAIGYFVRDILRCDLGLKLVPKRRWYPRRRDITRIAAIPDAQRDRKIRARSEYGQVICRCNHITKGEILDAVERMKYINVKTPSIDSVKFRTGATSGECQGSFCMVRIAMLLAQEYGVPLWNVTLKGPGSELGIGDINSLRREKK